MSDTNLINYNSSIKKVLKKVDKDLMINKSSMILLNDLLNAVNNKLVHHCQSKLQGSDLKQRNIALLTTVQAVNEVFPGELKNSARAEGHKRIILYYNGFLNYKIKPHTNFSFNKEVNDLVEVMYPGAKLQNRASALIDAILNDLFATASDKAIELGLPKHKIEINDFIDAFKDILPNDIMKHANSEGHRKVFQLEAGTCPNYPGADAVIKKSSIHVEDGLLKNSSVSLLLEKSPPKKIHRTVINYAAGLKKVAKDVNENISLKKPALELLVKFLNEVNYKLTDHCNNNIESLPENRQVDINIAEDAIDTLYHGELFNHAIAEADKDIFKFRHGLLQYNPKERLPKEVKKTRKVPNTPFIKGLSSLTETSLSGAKLNNTSKEFLDTLLKNLTEKMLNHVKSQAPSQQTLEYSDISTAMEEALPYEIRQHAHSEGAKAVLRYDAGAFTFKPNKRKRKRNNAFDLKKQSKSELKYTSPEIKTSSFR